MLHSGSSLHLPTEDTRTFKNLKTYIATNKHAWLQTSMHTSLQCSPTSVGLAQACPNYCTAISFVEGGVTRILWQVMNYLCHIAKTFK